MIVSACSTKESPDQHVVMEQEITAEQTPSPQNLELLKLITSKDSLLFQIGFNQIDTSIVASLVAKDFEFYHDEHGITESKATFVQNIEGIRSLPFKTWRTLVEGSTEVYPLYTDDQQLYGAIQHGMHEFYQQHEGEEAKRTNVAKFTHLWRKTDGAWELSRVLSYDHQVPE